MSNEESFHLEEVNEVWANASDVSLGPDGFSLYFFKNCWETIKVDMLNFVNVFQVRHILPKAVTTYFLSLIPNKDNPQRLEDYRPIFVYEALIRFYLSC